MFHEHCHHHVDQHELSHEHKDDKESGSDERGRTAVGQAVIGVDATLTQSVLYICENEKEKEDVNKMNNNWPISNEKKLVKNIFESERA